MTNTNSEPRNLIGYDPEAGDDYVIGPATAEQIEASDRHDPATYSGATGAILIDGRDGRVLLDGTWDAQDAKARGQLIDAHVAL